MFPLPHPFTLWTHCIYPPVPLNPLRKEQPTCKPRGHLLSVYLEQQVDNLLPMEGQHPHAVISAPLLIISVTFRGTYQNLTLDLVVTAALPEQSHLKWPGWEQLYHAPALLTIRKILHYSHG